MKIILAVLVIIVAAIGGVAGFIWSGTYNVAATVHHWDFTYELLREARDRSIEAHGQGIKAPSLKDPKLQEGGMHEFHEMCRLCHGAPGYPNSEFAQGLYPAPPNLATKYVQTWDDGQLFWIVKNGIKMTGMPSFGVTHGDNELWTIIAFLRRLPELKPEVYEGLVKSRETSGEEESLHRHEH